MVFPNRRNASRTDHDHNFVAHNVGADLQRQICAECGYISIDLAHPAGLRTEIPGEHTGLFGGTSEFVYGLARILNFQPAAVPVGHRFGERRKPRR